MRMEIRNMKENGKIDNQMEMEYCMIIRMERNNSKENG